MRFLGVGNECALSSLYLHLAAAGHEVRMFVAEPMCHGTLACMIPRVDDWRAELPWLRESGRDGVLLCEHIAETPGAVQDALRREGYGVVGGSAFGDRLEEDRAFGQAVLAGLGLPTLRVWAFEDEAPAQAFLAANPARYVLKFNGTGYSAADNYVGRLPDGRDVAAFLAARFRAREGRPASFILTEHVAGVEMGVGAYFDGERFLAPACLDWEHKRFFPGDLGELTGEMGTVATFGRSGTFFEATLGRAAGLLREGGHRGYVNLNTIVNEAGVWPLEFTCRFGYPGYAVLDPLQATPWAELLRAIAYGAPPGFRFETRPGFSVGVVLTTRPFPYIRHYVPEPVGLPVLFEEEPSAEDRRNLHYGEVGLDGAGVLVTSGYHGWTMVATGTGATIPEAQGQAYRLADRVVVPNLRYRRDIGDKLVAGDLARVERLGLLGPG